MKPRKINISETITMSPTLEPVVGSVEPAVGPVEEITGTSTTVKVTVLAV